MKKDKIITDIKTRYGKQLEERNLKVDISKTSPLIIYMDKYLPYDKAKDDKAKDDKANKPITKGIYNWSGCGRE